MKKIMLTLFCIVPATNKPMMISAHLIAARVAGSVGPLLRQAKRAAKPHLKNIFSCAKENPKQAAYILGGAAIGYKSSGDGVINME